MTTTTFRVLNPDGSEPDLDKVVREEGWAVGLCRDDIGCFAVMQDGTLILTDGDSWNCPPDGRFIVRWSNK